jgi:hypothetical protein
MQVPLHDLLLVERPAINLNEKTGKWIEVDREKGKIIEQRRKRIRMGSRVKEKPN